MASLGPWRLALPLALTLLASSVYANPINLGRYRGLRGGPTDLSAWSIYWNPALMAEPGTRIGLHLMGAARSATFFREAEANGVPPEEAGANAGHAEVSSAGVIPGLAGGWGTTLGDFELGFGAAFYVAQAGVANYDRDLAAPERYPGAVDGPQRWGTINTSLVMLSASAGVAAEYTPLGLSLGVAPVYTHVTLSTLRARNANRSQTLELGGELAEGRILLDGGKDSALRWVFGANWAPSEDASFAFTWHTGHTYNPEGKARITFGISPEERTTARINLPIAHTLRLGSQIHAHELISVRPYVEWSNWSIMKRQLAVNLEKDEAELIRIERHFEDVIGTHLRLDLNLVAGWVFHLGGAYETGATPEKTFEPGLAESDNVQLGAGFTVEIGEHLVLSTSYVWHRFFEVVATDSIQEPTQNGTYTDLRQYLTVDLEVRL